MVIFCVFQKKFVGFAKFVKNLKVQSDLKLILVEIEVEIRCNWGLKLNLRVCLPRFTGSFRLIFGHFWLF